MSEARTQSLILRTVGGPDHPDVKLFRQNVARAWQGDAEKRAGPVLTLRNPRMVTAGLCPGSSDLIGWRTVKVTPDMVGQELAVFTAIEVKSPRGRVTEKQERFLKAVRQAGGFAVVARSVADALAGIGIPAE